MVNDQYLKFLELIQKSKIDPNNPEHQINEKNQAFQIINLKLDSASYREQASPKEIMSMAVFIGQNPYQKLFVV